MKKVSVIVPCFNAGRWIGEALQSVLDQGIDEIETIVVDDGSTDRSADIVAKEFPSVKLIRTANNGPSRARNIGTHSSSGRYIQYLDADDMLAPGKLRDQLKILEDPGVDIVYGPWQRLVETDGGGFVKGEEVDQQLKNPETELFTAEFWCPMAAYLFKRATVEKSEKWNESLPYIQDVRFVLDRALHGARFAYCAAPAAYYRMRKKGSVSTKNPKEHNRDCLKNAIEAEKWWRENGGITEERLKALLKVYGSIAHSGYRNDRDSFESAYGHIKALHPGYVPEGPVHLRLASRILGYRIAERLLLWGNAVKMIAKHR